MINFSNNKKTFLAKLDQSKKGSIDKKIIPLIKTINKKEDYYTTSSCSGRVYFWKGSGKKNETEWLKVSHDLIKKDFFELENKDGLIWLRLEGFIIHICCKDLDAAKKLLKQSQQLYKKSGILSIANKIIVEIRSGEILEMPFYENEKLLYSGDLVWLRKHINSKLKNVWKNVDKFKQDLKQV